MPSACGRRFAVGAIAVVAVVFPMSAGEIGHAQQSGIPAEAPGFIGKTATLDTTGYSVGRRIFAPGAHNATWHMHAAGQLIYAESGHGRYQIKGQPIRELAPGDTGYIPAGTMHWHGSVPNEPFTMTFVTMGAGATTAGEPITDDIYLGKQ